MTDDLIPDDPERAKEALLRAVERAIEPLAGRHIDDALKAEKTEALTGLVSANYTTVEPFDVTVEHLANNEICLTIIPAPAVPWLEFTLRAEGCDDG